MKHSTLSTFFSKKQKDAPSNWHEDFIVHLASILKPELYVELGLYRCQLFNRIIPHAKSLIGLDIVPEVERYMKKAQHAQFVCGSTELLAKELTSQKKTIDLLFIDADHSHKWVEHDFNTYFPLIADHGIILLHDGFPKSARFTKQGYCGDGYKAIESLTNEAHKRGYEMMTIPVHPGLTLCRKRSNHLNWQ